MEFEKVEETFEVIGQNRPNEEKQVELALKLVEGFDEEAEEEQLIEATEIAKRLNNPKRIDELEVENFKPIHTNFVTRLNGLIKEVEDFFVSKGFHKMSDLVDEKIMKYFKVKISQDMKKATLHYICDNPANESILVYLQNFHETWGKRQVYFF